MGVKDKAGELGMKVMNDIMNDPAKAQKLAKAMGAYQKGRESLTKSQERVLHTMGLPSQGDVSAIASKLSGLRRKVKKLGKRLDQAAGNLA